MAETHKPQAVKLIDRYARWFTPAIIACAVAAWQLTGEAGKAVTVLIVGCPCALILAAPTAVVASIGRAAKAGITVFSPTLRLSLERFRANGATPLVVYRDRQPVGVLSVRDHLRPFVGGTIRSLKSLGIRRIGILSGDHEESVRRVAASAGLTDAWSGLKPQEKLRLVKDFQASGNVVMFAGDGINDAPALAAAGVGVAMGAAGTDVALETADIALMNDDISKLPFLIRLGRRMLRVIKWNIAFGMIFNAAAVVAGGSGLLSPIMGAVVHNIGSVLVVLSSSSIAFLPEGDI